MNPEKRACLKIESVDVGLIALVGKIVTVEHTDTKSTYAIQDATGILEAVHWIDEATSEGNRTEGGLHRGSYAKMIGAIRSQDDKKYIMVFKIAAVESEDEIEAHELEILHAKLKIKQMLEKENHAIGVNNELSNSLVGSPTSFANAKYDSVYKMVAGCTREEGMSREELIQFLSMSMTKADVNQALEFLSNEGQIFSTTDEDHFKTTDS